MSKQATYIAIWEDNLEFEVVGSLEELRDILDDWVVNHEADLEGISVYPVTKCPMKVKNEGIVVYNPETGDLLELPEV